MHWTVSRFTAIETHPSQETGLVHRALENSPLVMLNKNCWLNKIVL